MSYRLSYASMQKLEGVHPDLVKVVCLALDYSEVDFKVLEGVRSPTRQAQLVKAGASQTLNSRHITGHAVDLGALIDGEIRWDWPLYYKIGQAMRRTSQELGVPVRWGGVWDRRLADLGDNLAKEVQSYCSRHTGKDFIDGPHFELPAELYR
jgi:peptidoglycan L-alanyl-D-glutamate endopeptidase CwlK